MKEVKYRVFQDITVELEEDTDTLKGEVVDDVVLCATERHAWEVLLIDTVELLPVGVGGEVEIEGEVYTVVSPTDEWRFDKQKQHTPDWDSSPKSADAAKGA